MSRVCMVVMSLYPNDERVRREAAALERAGMEVDILCQRGVGQSSVERFGRVTAYRVIRQADKENLAQYLMVSSKFALAAFLKLQQLALKRRYKVIQAHNMPDHLVFVGLLQKLLGTPLVLDLHDLSVELYQSKWSGGKARYILPLVRTMEKVSCGLANQLITTSTGFKTQLLRRGIPADKVTLVLNTADPNIFQFQADRSFHPITKGLRLLYHGTVAERFGLGVAIEAVALLQERIPGTTLHLFGKYDPSCRRHLEERIQALGLGQLVSLGGWCNAHQISEVIRNADIGLVPYLRDDFMNIALSTKTFEYSATGLPVVASRLNSITSIFDDRCLSFFEPGDARDLADQIEALALDPIRRQRQTRQALVALEEISGGVMEQRYVKLMRGLMGHNGGSNGNGCSH